MGKQKCQALFGNIEQIYFAFLFDDFFFVSPKQDNSVMNFNK